MHLLVHTGMYYVTYKKNWRSECVGLF